MTKLKCKRELAGYKYVVVHVSFLEVVHDGVLSDFGQQHHVIHAALLHILTLPVVVRLKHTRERDTHVHHVVEVPLSL